MLLAALLLIYVAQPPFREAQPQIKKPLGLARGFRLNLKLGLLHQYMFAITKTFHAVFISLLSTMSCNT